MKNTEQQSQPLGIHHFRLVAPRMKDVFNPVRAALGDADRKVGIELLEDLNIAFAFIRQLEARPFSMSHRETQDICRATAAHFGYIHGFFTIAYMRRTFGPKIANGAMVPDLMDPKGNVKDGAVEKLTPFERNILAIRVAWEIEKLYPDNGPIAGYIYRYRELASRLKGANPNLLLHLERSLNHADQRCLAKKRLGGVVLAAGGRA